MKPLTEQTILITGATDGLGKRVALELAQRKVATLLLHGRNQTRLDDTKREIERANGNTQVETYCADFASLEQVVRLAAEIRAKHATLDTLINNAGLGGGKAGREISQEGYELRFAVNYLAPFLLADRLLPILRAAASAQNPARIVNVSSAGQQPIDFSDVMLERNYDPRRAYQQSKLAQILYSISLAEMLKDEPMTVNALHPASLMPTKMVTETYTYTIDTLEDGIKTVLYVATDPELDSVSGHYFDHLKDSRANAQAYDAKARQQLWELSRRLTDLA